MHDPSAYDPYLDLSSHTLDPTSTAYKNQYDGFQHSRDANRRHEKHNGHCIEEIQQPDEDSAGAEQQGLQPKSAGTMSSDAATFHTITWPDGPRFVKQSRVIGILTFILDAVLVLVALLFLVIAIMALRFANEPAQSSLAITIERAMKLVREADSFVQATHTDKSRGSNNIPSPVCSSSGTCPERDRSLAC